MLLESCHWTFLVFNLAVTFPVSRALTLAAVVYCSAERRFELAIFPRIVLIEMLHHTLHSAVHVKGWFGWKLHQEHHIKDYSLPLSSIGNHPVDLFCTVFGPISVIQLYSNAPLQTQLIPLLFIFHVGVLVHSDSHYCWFLDIHGPHHADGRYNLNGYFPFTDLLVGTFKSAERYTKPYGWR